MELKNTWKDANLPGAGQVYDLGTHLLDQVVSLFGRPASVTGFVENVRKMGDPDVPDTVSTTTSLLLFKNQGAYTQVRGSLQLSSATHAQVHISMVSLRSSVAIFFPFEIHSSDS